MVEGRRASTLIVKDSYKSVVCLETEDLLIFKWKCIAYYYCYGIYIHDNHW